jgi:hypothetical protein
VLSTAEARVGDRPSRIGGRDAHLSGELEILQDQKSRKSRVAAFSPAPDDPRGEPIPFFPLLFGASGANPSATLAVAP